MMVSVVNKIEISRVQVERTPGGCTALIQPVVVGFYNPFKGNVLNLWDEWLVNEGLNVYGTVNCQIRYQIAELIVAGMLKVSTNWFEK